MKKETNLERLAVSIMRSDGFNDYTIGLAKKANRQVWPIYLTRAANIQASITPQAEGFGC